MNATPARVRTVGGSKTIKSLNQINQNEKNYKIDHTKCFMYNVSIVHTIEHPSSTVNGIVVASCPDELRIHRETSRLICHIHLDMSARPVSVIEPRIEPAGFACAGAFPVGARVK